MRARLTIWYPRVGFGALVAAVFLTPIVFTRQTAEAFAVPKVTVLWLGLTVAVVGLASWTASARRNPLPRPTVAWGLAALLGWTALATALSPAPMLSLLGHYGRYDGLLGVAAGIAAVLVVAAYTWREPTRLRWVAYAVVAAGVVDLAYVTIQYAGLDWIDWVDVAGRPISRPYGLLGNSNFTGAHLAIVMPFALALRGRFDDPLRRWALTFLTVALGVGVWWTGTRGGVLAAVGGIAAVGLLTPSLLDRRLRWAALALTIGALGVVVLSATGETVPLAARADRPSFLGASSLEDRQEIWSASVAMTADHPIVGVGPDALGLAYPRYRRQRDVNQLPVNADEAHNVFLDRMATAGIPALLAYLAVLGVAGLAAWRARTRVADDQVWLLGAFGGGLAAYLLQGQVSIDVVPLALLGWISIGALLALADPRIVDRREDGTQVVHRPLPLGGLLAPVVVLVPLTALLVRPMVADAKYRDGLERGREGAALAVGAQDFEAATRWFGSEARYHARFADQLVDMTTETPSQDLRLHLLEEAVTAYERALHRAPGDVQISRAEAQTYVLMASEDPNHAIEHLRSSASIYAPLAATVRRDHLVHDDYGSVLELVAAEETGRRADATRGQARTQFEAALAIERYDVTAILGLARLARADGDLERAKQYFERALRLDPRNQQIRRSLAQVERELDAD